MIQAEHAGAFPRNPSFAWIKKKKFNKNLHRHPAPSVPRRDCLYLLISFIKNVYSGKECYPKQVTSQGNNYPCRYLSHILQHSFHTVLVSGEYVKYEIGNFKIKHIMAIFICQGDEKSPFHNIFKS